MPRSLYFLLNSLSGCATIAASMQKICRKARGRHGLEKKARCHASSEKSKINGEDLKVQSIQVGGQASPNLGIFQDFCERAWVESVRSAPCLSCMEGTETADLCPNFCNFSGAQESIPNNRFRQPHVFGVPVRQTFSCSVPSPHRLF